MNELKAVINYSAFFWFWDNMLYYGYMPSHNIPVCTPLSNRDSDLDGDQIRFAALYKDAEVYWHSVNHWIYGTPYSPGESATYYVDTSGGSSPRTGNILETRGVTPQGKIDPSAKAVNINIAYNGLPSLQNPSVSVGELLQLEKMYMDHFITLLLMLQVSLEVRVGVALMVYKVLITPQAKIQSGIKTVYLFISDSGFYSIGNPSTEKYDCTVYIQESDHN